MNTTPDSASSSRAAQRYLREFYDVERERQEKAPVPERRRPLSPLLALVVVPLCIVLTAVNLLGAGTSEEVFSSAQSEDAARFAVYVAIRQVEQFREEKGRLPTSIAEVDPSETRVTYRADRRGFVLTAEADSGVLIYRSGDDVTPFAVAARGRLQGVDR